MIAKEAFYGYYGAIVNFWLIIPVLKAWEPVPEHPGRAASAECPLKHPGPIQPPGFDLCEVFVEEDRVLQQASKVVFTRLTNPTTWLMERA